MTTLESQGAIASTRGFWLGVAAYLVPTFPIAYAWRLAVFAPAYDALGIYRPDPIIPLGLASMLIQSVVSPGPIRGCFPTAATGYRGLGSPSASRLGRSRRLRWRPRTSWARCRPTSSWRRDLRCCNSPSWGRWSRWPTATGHTATPEWNPRQGLSCRITSSLTTARGNSRPRNRAPRRGRNGRHGWQP
jgi:hypothetical protein